ncbi:hypothetical protein CEXT_570861 [Caerostris extrusa]|uniref:Uncharacterized protein n=1 Tax=Caerostris extrusa TaxID=172846 RepID=A0AAV4MR52_CAEEX|nr:hypothetical protein CEXT_570861 [Caerostris extrusa]
MKFKIDLKRYKSCFKTKTDSQPHHLNVLLVQFNCLTKTTFQKKQNTMYGSTPGKIVGQYPCFSPATANKSLCPICKYLANTPLNTMDPAGKVNSRQYLG